MQLYSELKRYFENTPKETLDKDWNEIAHLNDIGFDVFNDYSFSSTDKMFLCC